MAEIQMTTSRLQTREGSETRGAKSEESKSPRNYLHTICLLILPPFITSILAFLANTLTRLLSYLRPR